MSTRGRKQRAWRTIRCVVEVKVPPSNRSTEKDLSFMLTEAIADYHPTLEGLPLPRVGRPDTYVATPKVKGFTHVFRAEAKKPTRSDFEQLVVRGIFAILMMVVPPRKRGPLAMWIEDSSRFLGTGE